MNLILASRSPERAKILKDLGLEFEVITADIDETPLAGETVAETVKRLAVEKAKSIHLNRGSVVVAADTLIDSKGRALGKPKDLREAEFMLDQYKVCSPRVWTATAVINVEGDLFEDVSEAELSFQDLEEQAWQEFWNRKLWHKRAGGFSIFDHPCPLEIVRGNLDVVRGINANWLKKYFQKTEAKSKGEAS